MEDKKTITLTTKDIEEGLKKTFMCMFHDLRSNCHGLNITTPTEVFGFLLDKDYLNQQAGGILTDDKARALRDFLNNHLKENKSSKETKFVSQEWEEVCADDFTITKRLKVEGGYLYCRTVEDNTGISTSICFVPVVERNYGCQL